MRIELTRVTVTIGGAVHAPVNAEADGNKFRNSGRLWLLVTNAHIDESRTVTFPTPGQIGGLDIENPSTVIAAKTTVLLGPFPPLLFNQTSGNDIGMVYVNYSSEADLTVAVYQL